MERGAEGWDGVQRRMYGLMWALFAEGVENDHGMIRVERETLAAVRCLLRRNQRAKLSSLLYYSTRSLGLLHS